MKIGIDKISFYVPNQYLDLNDLAEARNIDPNKFKQGLLINKMSVAGLAEDIVTMAASASLNILNKEDLENIDLVIFTTESGIDYSKAASTHLISILGLKNNVRAVEMKQACYATTAAIYFAKGHILQNPKSKVLILASDIAKYGIGAPGEPTQGAGAVAMIISNNPNLLVIENQSGIYAEDVYDFFRPDGQEYALVDGKYSNEMYQKLFLETFKDYQNKTKLTINDFQALTFHIPYAKLGLKTLKLVTESEELYNNFHLATTYNKEIGNIYTGSLFVSLISLLEQADLKAGNRIGLYAYGSGSVSEFFSGILAPNYQEHLNKSLHETTLANRNKLTLNEYEKLIVNKPGEFEQFATNKSLRVQLKSIDNYKRKYQINE